LDNELKAFAKLEIKTLQFLTPFRGKRLLLAVSGGRDSVLLFHLLRKLAPKLKLDLVVGHVYHGHSEYRGEAFEFVRKLAGDFRFVSNVSNPNAQAARDDLQQIFPTSDEQSLREFRRDTLLAMARSTESHRVVLGHHRDDLFETRMIRLIRGTGLEGIKSMSMKSAKVLRPLLPFWREEIIQASASLKFLEDPTNVDSRYLRNWLRNNWLVQLEAYRPGAQKSLARSLENLSLSARHELSQLKIFIDSKGVDRSAILALSNVEQRQILASYLRERNVKNYSASQVDEVLKRLKTSQKSFDFKVAGRVWSVTSDRVRLHEA
jgi:tRNA(Ile)-lysidine synthase